jgi:hypothetical protein
MRARSRKKRPKANQTNSLSLSPSLTHSFLIIELVATRTLLHLCLPTLLMLLLLPCAHWKRFFYCHLVLCISWCSCYAVVVVLHVINNDTKWRWLETREEDRKHFFYFIKLFPRVRFFWGIYCCRKNYASFVGLGLYCGNVRKWHHNLGGGRRVYESVT